VAVASAEHMQICTLPQTGRHASIPILSFYGLDAIPATQPTASKHWLTFNTIALFVKTVSYHWYSLITSSNTLYLMLQQCWLTRVVPNKWPLNSRFSDTLHTFNGIFFQDNLARPAPKRQNHSGFYRSKR